MVHLTLIFPLRFICISSFNDALTFFFCEYLLWDVTAAENSVKFLTIYLIGRVDARFNYPDYRIGRWSITKERRKKWFHVKKFEQRNRVLLMNVLNFNISCIQFFRNQTHTNWNSILFFFFYYYSRQRKKLISFNATFQPRQVTH